MWSIVVSLLDIYCTSRWDNLTSINVITIHFVNVNKGMNDMSNTNCIVIGVCIIKSKNLNKYIYN